MDKVVYAFLREDNTPFYIGMGSIDRARNHKKGSRNYRWWEEMKSNPNYKFVIVDRSLTKQQAWDIEIDLIKEFGRQYIDSNGILTNIHEGGSWHEKAKEVVQFSLDGNKIKEWLSSEEASNEISVFPTAITNTCRGDDKSAGGFRWFYKSEVGDIDYVGPVKRLYNRSDKGNNSSKIHVLDMDTMIPFNSKSAAARSINKGKSGAWFTSMSFLSRFRPITKEEYYYLSELIKL